MLTDLHFKAWWYLESKDVCVCVPPKNGSTAFYRAAFNVSNQIPDKDVWSFVVNNTKRTIGPFSPWEIPKRYNKKAKLLAVRHPFERFLSLAHNKFKYENLHVVLLSIIAQPFCNIHWIPQAYFLRPDVTFIPYRFMLSELSLQQQECNVGNYPRGFNSYGTSIRADVEKYYAPDMHIWRVCHGYYNTKNSVT